MSLSSFFHTVKWFHLFLSDTNTQLNVKTVLFQTINFSTSTQFLVYTHLVICVDTVFVYSQLNLKIVLFQTIQFSMST